MDDVFYEKIQNVSIGIQRIPAAEIDGNGYGITSYDR